MVKRWNTYLLNSISFLSILVSQIVLILVFITYFKIFIVTSDLRNLRFFGAQETSFMILVLFTRNYQILSPPTQPKLQQFYGSPSLVQEVGRLEMDVLCLVLNFLLLQAQWLSTNTIRFMSKRAFQESLSLKISAKMACVFIAFKIKSNLMLTV